MLIHFLNYYAFYYIYSHVYIHRFNSSNIDSGKAIAVFEKQKFYNIFRIKSWCVVNMKVKIITINNAITIKCTVYLMIIK